MFEICRDTKRGQTVEVFCLLKCCAAKYPTRAKTSSSPQRMPKISQGKQSLDAPFQNYLLFSERRGLTGVCFFVTYSMCPGLK